MKSITFVPRDIENGHYDVILDGIRRYRIRGQAGSQTLLSRNTNLTFPSLSSVFSFLLGKYTEEPVKPKLF